MTKETHQVTCNNVKKKNIATLSLSNKSAFVSLAQKSKAKMNSKGTSIPIKEDFYDIPYAYNDTVIKVLAQNPYTLFVYWDISSSYREFLEKAYGKDFFCLTRPFLAVKNENTGNYFEIEVSDFTNNWYITVLDTKCKYKISLIRKSISSDVQIENNCLQIVSSNVVEAPNDHVLFDELSVQVPFVNVKTKEKSQVEISKLIVKDNPSLPAIHKLYNTYRDIKIVPKDSTSSGYVPY